MTPKKSHTVLLISTLFICLTLFAKISERRLAADRDGWVRNDTTLTAHTIYYEDDSIQLECPPPWVKWYEVDFKDPETGECIFKDLGLMADTSEKTAEYQCPELRRDLKHHSSDYIAEAVYTFIPDTNYKHIQFTDGFSVRIYIKKCKDIAEFYSYKKAFIRLFQEQKKAPKDRAFNRIQRLQQLIDEFYFQNSPAGSIEKYLPYTISGPDTNWTGGRFGFWPQMCKGLWHTYMDFQGTANKSIRQTYRFENNFITRIMEYYRSLHAIEPENPKGAESAGSGNAEAAELTLFSAPKIKKTGAISARSFCILSSCSPSAMKLLQELYGISIASRFYARFTFFH